MEIVVKNTEEIQVKKRFTFGKLLIILSVILLLICIFYWIKLSNYIDEFEKTLNIPIETTKEEIEFDILPEEIEPAIIPEEIESTILLEEIDLYMNLTLEVAESYAKFTSADLKFNDIKNYFEEDSEILELLETYNSNRYNSHKDSYFENIEILQPTLTNENQVKCQVSFDYIVITSDDKHYYPSSYTLYFNKDNKKVISLEMN